MKSQIIGLGFTMTLYLIISVIGIALFGNDINSSVLVNFGTITTPTGKPFWESAIIQFAFIIVLMCHIPFVYFAGKEAVLIIVDELHRKSISTVLQIVVDEMEITLNLNKTRDLSSSGEPTVDLIESKDGTNSNRASMRASMLK